MRRPAERGHGAWNRSDGTARAGRSRRRGANHGGRRLDRERLRGPRGSLPETVPTMSAPVLLAIDVGNTHTVIGVYQGDKLVRHWRILSDPGRTSDEYGVLLSNLSRISEMPIP